MVALPGARDDRLVGLGADRSNDARDGRPAAERGGGTWSIDILADHAVISRQTATVLRAAAGLRNRIAHGYAMLEHERIHAEAQAGIPALRTFLAAVARGLPWCKSLPE